MDRIPMIRSMRSIHSALFAISARCRGPNVSQPLAPDSCERGGATFEKKVAPPSDPHVFSLSTLKTTQGGCHHNHPRVPSGGRRVTTHPSSNRLVFRLT